MEGFDEEEDLCEIPNFETDKGPSEAQRLGADQEINGRHQYEVPGSNVGQEGGHQEDNIEASVRQESNIEGNEEIEKLLEELEKKYPQTKEEKEMDGMFRNSEYPSINEIMTATTPTEGMVFQSEKQAFHFFAVYARRVGFAIKRSTSYRDSTGEITKLLIVCNKHRKNKVDDNPVKKRRSNYIQKTDCEARVQLKLRPEGWVVDTVNLEHNHNLLPSQWLTRFMRCHRHISGADKSFISILQSSRVPPRKVMTVYRSLRGSFRNIDFDEVHIKNIAAAERQRHVNRDVEDLLELFKKEQTKIPGFYYSLQLDETDRNTVRSIFWTDLMGRKNYELYGDYLSFDTTFSTNRYDRPFAPFIGVNNHGNTVIFGCALLKNQKADTFNWAFNAFVDAMGGKKPINIITDQDKAIRKSILTVFPDVMHRFCFWHILENIKKNLKTYLAAKGKMGDMLWYLIKNAFTPAEFEQGWQEIISHPDHRAEGNTYLRELYDTRNLWVPAYFKNKLFPFSSTTGRSESTNSLFKGYVLRKDTVTKFFEQYQIIQEKNLIKLDKRRYISEGTVGATWSNFPIEKEVMTIFTRPIVSKLQKEMKNSTSYIVEEEVGGTHFRLKRVSKYDKAEYEKDQYEVSVSNDGQQYNCSCAKFERDGLHCCHVFNILIRKGQTKLPESFIHKRWTIDMDRRLEEMTRSQGVEQGQASDDESSVRYIIMMSKMAKHCAQLCKDEQSSQMFDDGVDKLVKNISKKRAAVATNEEANVAAVAENGGMENNPPSTQIVYKDPPEGNSVSVPRGKRLRPAHEIIAMQQKKRTQVRRCTVCRSETHFRDKCPDRNTPT